MITGRYVSTSKFYCSEQTLKGKPCPREGYLVFLGKPTARLVCYSHHVKLSKE